MVAVCTYILYLGSVSLKVYLRQLTKLEVRNRVSYSYFVGVEFFC